MKRLLYFLPLIAWLIISTILLTLPGSAFPQEDWMDKIWMDKWIHIGMFSIMAFLLCWALVKSGITPEKYMRYFIISGLLCISYGVIMEFVQKYYVPRRSFDTGDIIADIAGSVIGVWFSRRVYIKK